MSNQTVEVGIRRPLDVEFSPTDVEEGLIVHQEGTVRVLQGGVSVEDSVVRLDDRR